MTQYTLKAIIFGADFRKSDGTIAEEFGNDKRYQGPLTGDQCYAFVSCGGDQILWVLGYYECDGRMMLDTRRWRLLTGTWSPWLLAEYAEAAGIRLKGVKSFGQRYAEWKGEKQKPKLKLVA